MTLMTFLIFAKENADMKLMRVEYFLYLPANSQKYLQKLSEIDIKIPF